jgi:hypothetical protein
MAEPSTTDAHIVRFGLFELNLLLRSGELSARQAPGSTSWSSRFVF